ncbi:MAG TPA: carboxypeptidase regulatory-like domain-containing protein [Pyrinomonadaceae bacterium]|nr:carboxypeptidase regulatory-like domain-containing protein [Pyrinomonadaceae bacterium]
MFNKSLPRFNRALLLCASLALASATAFAQSQATSGNIEGRVLDPEGAAVPGVTVTATNQQTGFEKTAVSDEEGNYRLIVLPPGTYRIVASGAQGFQNRTLENAAVSVGGQTNIDIYLGVGLHAGEIIDVSAEAPVVETTRTSVSTTVNERDIENLPVSGRNYLDFATLTPGVVRDPTRQGDLSVGGQKGTLNSLQVDGADNNNTFFGQAFGRTGVRPPYQFSEESVKEFQVNQNGFSAEFGRAGGAVINVVTKSGTNDFHGGVFEYFRDESLNANAPNIKGQQGVDFDLGRRLNRNKRPPQQINQFGFRLGGPIVRNRAFFFGTYDGQRQDLPNVVDAPNLGAQPAAVQALLRPRLAPYQISRNQDVFLLKSDILVNASNQLSLRFNRQNFTGVNNEFTGALATEEHSGDSLARTTTFSGTLASTITSSVVNEFRFQFARDAEPGTANSELPETQIQTGNGFLLLGRNNFSPRETTIRRAQVINNLSYVRGQHNYKVGVDLNFDRILNFFPGFFSGQYTFNSYADFASNANCAAVRTPGQQPLPNCPSAFQQRFALPNTSGATSNPNSTDYAVFLQDDWRATRKLTLNLGVRYDYQKLAAPPLQNTNAALLAAGLDTSRQPSDGNNIAPRVGFAYDVGGNGKTVVRGGYGIFYGRTTAIMLGTAHTGNGIQTTGVNFSGAGAIAAAGLVYPNVVTTAPTAVAGTPDIFLFAEDYAQPYVQQARLGFEHELMKNMSVSVTYLFFRGVHLSRTRDINLRAPEQVTATGAGQTFTVERFPGASFTATAPMRPIPGFGRINLFESTANSRYDGLAFQAQRRFTRRLQFLASYTYSKAKDDKPDQTAVVPGGGDDAKIVQNQTNLRDDYSAADSDLRHRFVFSPVYEFGKFTRGGNRVLNALLSDYTVSSIVQLQSGFAFSQTIGADLNRDGNSRNDRVPGTRRNQFYTPATYQFDARLTRTIPFSESVRLRLILEGFNLFNRANVATVNTNFFAGRTATVVGGVQTLTLTSPAPAAAYGLPRAFLTPRELQLAIKFDF